MVREGESLCRQCRVEEETGTQLVFRCQESYGLRPWDWTLWEELDDRRKWPYTMEGEGGKVVIQDRVENFFVNLDEVMIGVR